MKKSDGFALLLTLIVVSVIGAVAFGIGRLTLAQFREGVRFQDSQDALQTAEAGIEDGLLRYRFNRNTEVPVTATSNPYNCASNTETTQSSAYVLRVDLDAGTTQCVNPKSVGTPAPTPTHHVYDLEIYYKATSLNISSSPLVSKDSTYVISGINQTSGTVTLGTKDANNAICAKQANAQQEYVQIEYPGSGLSPRLISENSIDYISLQGGSFIASIPGVNSISIRPLETCFQVSGSLSGSQPIDFGTTQIVAIGYFNGVRRQLLTSINRSTGATQGISNFVLFAPGGLSH